MESERKTEGGRVAAEIVTNWDHSENLADVALTHWRNVLKDPQASDTAKDSAAKGLAGHERQRSGAASGQIHRMSRAELTHEIARVRDMLK